MDTIVKVKPEGGHTYSTKWDILRAMRKGVNYTATVIDDQAEIAYRTRDELKGQTVTIAESQFLIAVDGVTVTKVQLVETSSPIQDVQP